MTAEPRVCLRANKIRDAANSDPNHFAGQGIPHENDIHVRRGGRDATAAVGCRTRGENQFFGDRAPNPVVHSTTSTARLGDPG